MTASARVQGKCAKLHIIPVVVVIALSESGHRRGIDSALIWNKKQKGRNTRTSLREAITTSRHSTFLQCSSTILTIIQSLTSCFFTSLHFTSLHFTSLFFHLFHFISFPSVINTASQKKNKQTPLVPMP